MQTLSWKMCSVGLHGFKKIKHNVKIKLFFSSLQMGEEPKLFTPNLYILKNNLYV